MKICASPISIKYDCLLLLMKRLTSIQAIKKPAGDIPSFLSKPNA
jgi:hypothetical protein